MEEKSEEFLIHEWQYNDKQQNICIFSEKPFPLVHSFLSESMKNENDICTLVSHHHYDQNIWPGFSDTFSYENLVYITPKVMTRQAAIKKHGLNSSIHMVIDTDIFLPKHYFNERLSRKEKMIDRRNKQFKNMCESKELETLEMNCRALNIVLILVISEYFGNLPPHFKSNFDTILFDSDIQKMKLFKIKEWEYSDKKWIKMASSVPHKLWALDMTKECSELSFMKPKEWKFHHKLVKYFKQNYYQNPR